MIYQTTNSYEKFDSYIDFEEFFIPLEENIKIHAILFQPPSKPIGTIFHHLGNGMDLNTAQLMYKPLLQDGFQME